MSLAWNIPQWKMISSDDAWLFCLSFKVKCINVHIPLGFMSSMLCPDSESERENLLLLLSNLKDLLSVHWDKSSTRHRASCLMSCSGFPGPVLLTWGWLARSSPYSCSLCIQTLTSCPVGCQWGGPQPFSARLVSLSFTGSASHSFIIRNSSSWMHCQELTGKSSSTSVSEPWTGPHCWKLQGMKILGIALHSAWERALHPCIENNVRTASYPLNHSVCSGPQRVSSLRAQMTA